MLTNLAYFKLLKSLPEDTLTNVNSQLVLLAAAGALNKVPEPAPDIAVNDILASADFLKQQGLLECLAAQFPPPSIDLSPSSLPAQVNLPSPTGPTTSAQSSSAAITSASSPERSCLSPPKLSSEHTSDLVPAFQTDGAATSPSRANSTSPTNVKEEPKSPGALKASFRPVASKSSPPGTPLTSTVHWGGATAGPPPNKTCTSSTTTSLSKLHPCDTSILNLLNPYKPSISLESKLQKFCLSGKGETSSPSLTSPLTNINWSSSSANLSGPRRSYNCYWMSHVGPCNRQFLDKDDLYKHLKSHVNDLEALTPATAMLQPLNPTCVNCDKNRGFTKVHGRYQPYSKCSKFSRCACRR